MKTNDEIYREVKISGNVTHIIILVIYVFLTLFIVISNKKVMKRVDNIEQVIDEFNKGKNQ